MVRQQVLTLDAPMTQDSLTRTAGKFNHLYAGVTAEQIRADSADPLENQLARIVQELMTQEDRQASQEIYRDGLGYMLDSPEFRQIHSLRQVVDLLEGGMFFEEMLSEIAERGGVQVIIGGEGRWEELSDCSVVVARYGGDSPVSGALGVVGPTRMPYAHAISVVSYVAELMGDLIYDWYGY
jgi:heat-inducible transcriptional repressor